MSKNIEWKSSSFDEDSLNKLNEVTHSKLISQQNGKNLQLHSNFIDWQKNAGQESFKQKKGFHSFDDKKRKEVNSKAGKIGGKVTGNLNVESGHWAKCHELAKEVCYIPVLQCNKKTGEVIKEWKGIKVAADKLKISHTAINNNLKGLSRSSGGFIWKYKENL